MNQSVSSSHKLCYRPLFNSGQGFAFPCDQTGAVALDALSERARNNYFFARAMVGRELATPAVEPVSNHSTCSQASRPDTHVPDSGALAKCSQPFSNHSKQPVC